MLEDLIKGLTEALNANTKALTASAGTSTTVNNKSTAAKASPAPGDTPLYWTAEQNAVFGEGVLSDWESIKDENPDAHKIPKTTYDKLVAAAKKTEDKAKPAAKPAKKAPASKSSKSTLTDLEVDVEDVTEAELTDLIRAFVPPTASPKRKEIGDEECANRAEVAKGIMQRLGVSRAKELKNDQQRGILAALIHAYEDGVEFDPTSGDFDYPQILNDYIGGGSPADDEDDDLL